jgi:hypothetical protein
MIYSSTQGVCDYSTIVDEATMDFLTPVNGIILLAATDFGNKNDYLKIYPNPAKSVLNIETTLKIERINIYDASGKMVKTWQSVGKNIDVSQLKNGIYHLEIFTDKGRFYEKFLVGN